MPFLSPSHRKNFSQHLPFPLDPLLYDRLIRRHQTASDREQQGRERAYADTLEADLVRSEAKREAVQHPDPNSPVVYSRQANGEIVGFEQDQTLGAESSKEEDWERWIDVMGQRFLRGEDADFEYEAVDGNDDFDDRDEEARAGLERYLEGEKESFVGDGKPTGETGVQDF